MFNKVIIVVMTAGIALSSCSNSNDQKSNQSLRDMLINSKIVEVSPYDVVWSSVDTMLLLDRRNYIQESRVDSFLARYNIMSKGNYYLRGGSNNEIIGNEYLISDSVIIRILIEPVQVPDAMLRNLDSIFTSQRFKQISILYHGVSTSSILRARETILTRRIDSVLKHGK